VDFQVAVVINEPQFAKFVHEVTHASQARQRRPRHSRHPSLSRPPIDHVHGPLHGLDAESIQKLLEGLTIQASHSDFYRRNA
jgi:hypothetical protein